MSNIPQLGLGNNNDGWQHIHKEDGSYAGYSTRIVEGSVHSGTPKGSNEKRTYATVQSQVLVTGKDGRTYRLHFETKVDITTNESARHIFDQLKAMKNLAKDMTGTEINSYFAQGAEFKTMNLTDSWDKAASIQMACKPAGASRDVEFQMICKKTGSIYTSNAPNESTWSYDLSGLHLKDRGWMKLINVETKKAREQAAPGEEGSLAVQAKGVFRGTWKKVKQSISGPLNTISKIPKIGAPLQDSFLMEKAEPSRHKLSAKMADTAFAAYRDSLAVPDAEIHRDGPAPPPEHNEIDDE